MKAERWVFPEDSKEAANRKAGDPAWTKTRVEEEVLTMTMPGHPETCECFCCVYDAEAAGCIAAGLLDPWDYALMLAHLLARMVSAHASAIERRRYAAFFASLLYAAAERPTVDPICTTRADSGLV